MERYEERTLPDKSSEFSEEPGKPLKGKDEILLTAEEKMIVDLISEAIIKKTFERAQ